MKKFHITVNGKAYDVDVEEIGAGAVPSAPAVAPAAPAAAPATPAKAAPTPAAAPADAQKVSAPMPGSIIDVKVSEGASVTSGQVLVILEAMKMENEIVAPCDGKITGIQVKKGDSVNSNDLLMSIVK